MSVRYVAVQWNRHKRIYDALLLLGVALYLGAFIGVGAAAWGGSPVILLIRALGTCAILMLHVILCIGPLARLSDKFAPLLYNRRHFGVAMACVATAHGALSVLWYHGFGVVNPIVSVFTSDADYTSFARFPFQPLGVVALVILLMMAATSHDFWLKNLTPRVWKALHMGVYVAYALLVAHVALGVLQSEKSPVYHGLLLVGVATVVGLHLVAGFRERMTPQAPKDHWVDAGPVDTIENNRGRVIELPGGHRVAVFRYDGKVSALSNVCAHQMGPLGEGKVVDGCLTCPWHGYQYLPHNGQSPPPFTEKIETHDVRIASGRVMVKAEPNPPGTPVQPALMVEEHAHG